MAGGFSVCHMNGDWQTAQKKWYPCIGSSLCQFWKRCLSQSWQTYLNLDLIEVGKNWNCIYDWLLSLPVLKHIWSGLLCLKAHAEGSDFRKDTWSNPTGKRSPVPTNHIDPNYNLLKRNWKIKQQNVVIFLHCGNRHYVMNLPSSPSSEAESFNWVCVQTNFDQIEIEVNKMQWFTARTAIEVLL